MSGTFPTSPGPGTVNLTSDQPVIKSESESRRLQTRVVAGHLWKMRMQWPVMTRSQFAPIFAFSAKQRGDSFQIVLPNHSLPQGGGQGSATVTSNKVAGSLSVDISGFSLPAIEVTNPFFLTTDVTQWDTVDASVTIAGTGAAVVNHAGSYNSMLADFDAFDDQQAYRVRIKLSTYTSGSLDIFLNGSVQESITSTTEHLIIFTNVGGGIFRLLASAFVGDIDYVIWQKYDPTLKAGDIIKFANHTKVYMVAEDAYINVSAIAPVTLVNPLVEPVVATEAITYSNVPFTVTFASDPVEWKGSAPNLASYSVNLIESIS